MTSVDIWLPSAILVLLMGIHFILAASHRADIAEKIDKIMTKLEIYE